jgi:hypothetical protein
MNHPSRTLLTILFLSLALHSHSQDNATILISYVKVSPSEIQEYLNIEKEWKKIHEARLEKGHIIGWQIWQKMYAGEEDEYQFIVINWYKNFQSTHETGFREIMNQLYSPGDMEDLMDRTLSLRSIVRNDVFHRAASTEIYQPTAYLVVSPMRVNPGMETEYLKMEREIFKPIHEEAIRQGLMASWSVWYKWPFEENDQRYVVMNGFGDYPQMSQLDYADLFRKVHPEQDMDEIWDQVAGIRKNTSVQIWRLLDSIYANPDDQ